VNFKERKVGLIIKAAQLALRHASQSDGYILFGDDTQSEGFDSIESAIAVVKSAQKADKITEAEAEYLLAAIKKSALPSQEGLESREEQGLLIVAFPFGKSPDSDEDQKPPTLH
jgi:hypothetical protein